MYTYREQLAMLDGIRLMPNQHLRIDCPFCGGTKTFTISNVDGSRLWHCFKASCGVRGAQSIGRSPDQIRKRLEGSQEAVRKAPAIPSILSSPDHHPHVLRYLERNGSMDVYRDGLCHIKFDPASDRVLFYMADRKGAVGRSLRGEKPKWKAYGDTAGILTVGSGDTLVLVEDAASACSVGRVSGLVGGALMGTNISPEQRHQLGAYQHVVLALDKDASRKSLMIQASLRGYVNVSVRFLEEDLKYLTIERVREVLA
jgi:hypothetical protein